MESLRGSRGQGTAVRVSRGLSFGWKTLRSEDRPSAFRVTLSGALETWYSFTWELREGTYQVSGPGGRVRANAEARSSNRSVFEVSEAQSTLPLLSSGYDMLVASSRVVSVGTAILLVTRVAGTDGVLLGCHS